MLKRDLLPFVGDFVQVYFEYDCDRGFLVYDRKAHTFGVVACPQADPYLTLGCLLDEFFASDVVDCWSSFYYCRLKDVFDVNESVWRDTGTRFQNFKTRSRRKGRR